MSNLLRTATGHVVPSTSDAFLPMSDAALSAALTAVFDAMTVPDGTLTMTEVRRLDRQKRMIQAEQERRATTESERFEADLAEYEGRA